MVAVKCFNHYRTNNGEGTLRERIWRWGLKARGANGIRYPGSPGCKLYSLNIMVSSRDCGAEAKAEVSYLGSIVARPKLKGIGGGVLQGVTRAVQLDSTPWILPGATAGWRSVWRAYLTRWEEMHGRRKLVLWNALLNQVTSETCVCICYLEKENNTQTALVIRRKVQATIGEYVPNPLGYTRAAMVRAMRRNFERRSKSPNSYLSPDWTL